MFQIIFIKFDLFVRLFCVAFLVFLFIIIIYILLFLAILRHFKIFREIFGLKIEKKKKKRNKNNTYFIKPNISSIKPIKNIIK
jgi:hypothetical protein